MTAKTATKNGGKVEIDWHAMLVEAMNAPGSLGNTYCRFYNYSFLNQLRLMMQGVTEPVATYRRWSELGYQVQRGTHAKCVLAPIMINKTVEKNGVPQLNSQGKPIKRQILVGFRESNTVFGFSDTDGDELPDIEFPSWSMDSALDSLNVKRVKFTETDGNTQGYSMINRKGEQVLAINPTAKYPAKTVLHELAHIVLGHCRDLKDGVQQEHLGLLEFEAEAVAYLSAKELELIDWDARESRAYIQTWMDNATGGMTIEEDAGEGSYDAVTDKHISRIFGAVNKILVAGRKTAEAQDSSAA